MMMDTRNALQSRLTDRYQTTVPEAVRRALNLGKRDRLDYRILPDGSVVMTRADVQEDDPALSAFLTFLARDIECSPSSLRMIDADLRTKIVSLTEGVAVDLEAPLHEERE
jgi:antitoxin PrlF